jgi:hypothetical protein
MSILTEYYHALSGVLMKRKKRNLNYIAKSLDLFLQSFRMSLKKLFFIIIADALFYALAAASGFLLYIYLTSKAKILDTFNPQIILSGDDISMADSATKAIDSFVVAAKIGGILWILLIILLVAVFAYFIWMRVSEKKKSFKGFLKFFAFNFVFLGLFFAANIVSADNMALHPFFAFFLLIAFFIFMMTVYALYAMDNELIGTIKRSFRVLRKFYQLILPLTISLLIIIVVSMIFLTKIPSAAAQLLLFALIILFMAWFRNYHYLVIEDISK